MKDVLTPTLIPEADDSSVQYRPVSALEAAPDVASGAVMLEVQDHENERAFHFVLSLPAAAQLSRQLRKAVKTYLRSGDGSEGTR